MIRSKVRDTIARYAMIKKGGRLCVALSGGPDSTALLHILNSLKSELGIELSACHVNHLLRGKESDGDARFAAGFCERLSIPIHTARVDVKKYRRLMGGSVQSAARELRYMVFKRIFRNNVADRVATAHVADDDTETVLINFLRGAGPQGLSGIPPVRGKRFIRPLIDVHKEEVLEYLERERIPYREDSSNMDAKYLRNALRKSLIPIIEKEFNPGLTGTLHRSAAVFDDIQRFLTRQAEDAIKKIAAPLPDGRGLRIDCSTFALMDRALQREVIKNIMIELRKSGSGISFENVESLRNLANGKITAGDVLLPGIRASVSHGKFYVSKEGFTRSEDFCYSWPGKRSLLIKELNCRITMEAVKPPSNLNLNGDTVYLDGDAVLPEAVFRNRREGDRFRPLGGSGSQKLKQFFIDKKIPRWERDSILLLASGSDILWIAGYRLSEGVRVGKDTKNVLRLKIEYEPRM